MIALEEDGSATAKGLVTLRAVRCGKFLLATWFLCDALPVLAKLSQFFQKSSLNIADVGPMVSATRQALLSMKSHHGTNLAKLLSMRKDGVIRLSEASHDAEAVDVLVSAHVVDQFHSARKQFLQAVMDNLGARFPVMELVDSFSVFDPRNLPKLEDEQIYRYGIRQVDVLARHFSKEQTIEGQASQPGLVDYDMAVSEWILLRSLMSTAYRGMNCEQFVSSLLAKHADVFPALCVVASAAAVLPVTNTSPERGFSTQNRILTKLRNRLLEGTLDQLMRISIEGPPSSQMDYRRALQLWRSQRTRRIL